MTPLEFFTTATCCGLFIEFGVSILGGSIGVLKSVIDLWEPDNV